jgi:predicted phage terminase large subunit-like protein
MASLNEVLIDQLAIQDALLTRVAERSFRDFVEHAWPILEPTTPFLSNWHIDYLAEHLEAVSAGECPRLLINMPPRSMKSLLVSVLWPTWEWIRRPSGRWIFASYAESLASKHSIDRRTVLQSDWYRTRWGTQVKLASDQNVKNEFMTTRRGHMIATSVGAGITGKGGDRIVVDDPHNPTQAESDAQRQVALSYFTQSLVPRLDDKKRGAIVVVMQRLHERDLSALCQDLAFTHVCLPAEAEERTVHAFPRSGRQVSRDPGNLLWPAREGRSELDMLQRVLGSAAYAGQYQQRPAPAGGTIFNPNWFKYYKDVPRGLSRITQSWDMAFKDRADSDYVVGLVGGTVGADIYIVERVKGQWSFSETCVHVQRFAGKHPGVHTILIEDAANGPAIIDTLRRKLAGIIPVKPDGGKSARAYAVQPTVEAGNVYLPDPRPHGTLLPERAWVDDFLHQLRIFPKGAHDDDVDAFTQLVLRLQKPQRSLVW